MYIDDILFNMYIDDILFNMYIGDILFNMYIDDILFNMYIDNILFNMYIDDILFNMYIGDILFNMYIDDILFNMYIDNILFNMYIDDILFNMYIDDILFNMYIDDILFNMYIDDILFNMYIDDILFNMYIDDILFNMYIDDIFEMVNNGNTFLKEGKKINALMYADDLILLSDSTEGLQNLIDKMDAYCDKWKLEANIKKSKIMIFNKGNKLINNDLRYKSTVLENVKRIKYLGFSISARNCTFSPTIDDLSIRANPAIFALNNKYKISKLPKKLAIKLFNSLIAPMLLYGSEVWGPYLDNDYLSWESSKIERVQTQFIKRLLGCNIQTNNTVEPLIAATFTAKVRWPLLGGGRYSEVYYKFSLCVRT